MCAGGSTLRKDSEVGKVRRVGSTAAMPKAGSTGSFGNLRARVRIMTNDARLQ